MKKTIVAAVAALAAVGFGSSAAMAQDAAAGEAVAKKCIACHTFEQGGANKVGPNLFGVTEHGPGKIEGFKYSDGFMAAANTGFAWDEEHLQAYLTDPTAFLRDVSGDAKARSKMTFKLPKEEDRANVIAYLQTLK